MRLPPPDPLRPWTFQRYLAHAQRRHRRSSGSGSAYVLTVFGLFYGSPILIWAWLTLTGPPPENPALCGPAAVAVLAAGLLMLGAGWSFLGPVPASAAWASWVLSTPLDRAMLLARRVWMRLFVAAWPGAVLGVFVAVAAGLRDSAALAVLVIGGAGGVIVCGAAILGQRRDVRPSGRVRWGAVLGLLAIATFLQLFPTARLPTDWWWPAAVAVSVGGFVVAVTAGRSAGRIPLHRLTAADAVQMVMMLALAEQSLEWVAVAGRGGHRRGGASRRPLTGTGRATLVAVCRRLFWRNRIGVARFVGAAAVPSLIAALGHGIPRAPVAMAVISVLAAIAATNSAVGPARRFHHDPRLQAHFGIDTTATRRTMLTIPAVMTISWTVLAVPALILGGPPVMVVIVPALAYAVVAYRLTRPEYVPSYVMGQQYQADMVRYFFRGPAQLVIACGVAAFLAKTLAH